ncbi:TlpA family protein disulfide reductase [Cetobacterium sp. 8H]|uniref:peroxiredoxin family protein n=1 Tax=Cetobacterium sp. 8H TaxID=2759681 RepID=UPI00163C73AA|nr:TlpA disulfide reductase family protein [Cetobacterium sp. 8H]MBC2850862.1 TlpA family protein disulfide reductase [Cetobacterium sp. 8H]
MKKLFRVVLLMGLIFNFGFSEERDPREKKLTYMIGEKVQDFEVKSLDGKKTITLDELKGKKVFLNFTTTWCPDCIAEKKIFGPEYDEKFKNMENLEVIIVFGPYKTDNREKVEKYIKENNYKFPVYYDTEDKDLHTQFGVINIPTTFLIDENGVLEDVNVESGYKNMKDFK